MNKDRPEPATSVMATPTSVILAPPETAVSDLLEDSLSTEETIPLNTDEEPDNTGVEPPVEEPDEIPVPEEETTEVPEVTAPPITEDTDPDPIPDLLPAEPNVTSTTPPPVLPADTTQQSTPEEEEPAPEPIRTAEPPVTQDRPVQQPATLQPPVQAPAEAEPDTNESEADRVYRHVDVMPQLIGGNSALARQIRYPSAAKRMGIQGQVTLQFIVDEAGQVQNVSVVKSLMPACDKEAVRVIQKMKFQPGRNQGKPVKVWITKSIAFQR